jgi:hypothetical protein
VIGTVGLEALVGSDALIAALFFCTIGVSTTTADAVDGPGLLILGTVNKLTRSSGRESTTTDDGPELIPDGPVRMGAAVGAGDAREGDALLWRSSTTTSQYCKRAAGMHGFQGTNSSPDGALTAGSMRMGFKVKVGGGRQAARVELKFGNPILWKIKTVAHMLCAARNRA